MKTNKQQHMSYKMKTNNQQHMSYKMKTNNNMKFNLFCMLLVCVGDVWNSCQLQFHILCECNFSLFKLINQESLKFLGQATWQLIVLLKHRYLILVVMVICRTCRVCIS